jgi:hypothetical protein
VTPADRRAQDARIAADDWPTPREAAYVYGAPGKSGSATGGNIPPTRPSVDPLTVSEEDRPVFRLPDGIRLRPLPPGGTYVWGYEAGFAAGRRIPRRTWLAVVAATVALVLAAFAVGRASAAPRAGSLPLPESSAGAQLGAPPEHPEGRRPGAAAVSIVAAPTGAIDAGAATGRNPKLTPSPEGIAGQATWWDTFGSGLYAAIRPDLGRKGQLAVVCGGQPFHCLTLPITTSCFCGGPGSDRLIDLSLDAFVDFAPPGVDRDGKPRQPGWQGVIRVTVQVLP